MTTITLNDTATQMIFSNSTLTTSLDTLTIQIGVQCNTALTPISILSKIPTIVSNSFILNVTDVFPNDTKFKDGVYYIKLTMTDTSGFPLTVTETITYNCVLVDYDLKCNLSSENLSLYRAMLNAEECDTCSCEKLCEIFNFITNQQTDDTTNCGCD